ncbi:hypothetical protein EKH79_00345 [Dyella dinghuensis]|uniref:DUF6869 domain-containing protein n=1 Tax=Dyella dinghuensis TaxID=1920169 RepID=A0A3S0Q196_9GAMM|nr:hypothetical protein [Dyella dinghuensis]RUL67091.1 hypothetical protein EKH79_00345 [Dyella dinghuensis]
MDKQNVSVEEIASAYLAYLRTQDEQFEWVLADIYGFALDKDWNGLWALVRIVALWQEDIDSKTLCVFAAGPLEDLLDGAGLVYIDRVESFARECPRFARMLTGVWPSSIDADVWKRVTTICRRVPDPFDMPYRFH